MAERPRGRRARFVGLALAGAILALLVWSVLRSQELPRSVEPVAWGRETCAFCRMHVVDPRFAAQLQTKDRRVLAFDDPGCLVLYVAERNPLVHSIYFHHMDQDRWLSSDHVAFAAGQHTPMGYGFGAVDAAAPGAISYAELRQRLARSGAGGMPR